MSTSTKPLILYTAPTPNGWKVSTLLEELKAAYGLDYDFVKVDLKKSVQKEPWFLKLNPNGRIPTLVDQSRGNFVVFESAAILLYLEQHYDKDRKFSFDPETQPNDYSELLQWIFFGHGELGPAQTQSFHYHSIAADIPYAKNRYLNETKRLFSVLETRLTGRDWLAGAGRGIYTIADIHVLSLVKGHRWSGIESLDEWPNVKAWLARFVERPAVQVGMHIP